MILSGDTRQHGAVAASDALRAIEQHGRIRAAEIRDIRRQNPSLARSQAERRSIREYRTAVKAAAEGKVLESLDRLDRLGWVREFGESQRRDVLAREYLASVSRNENTLVVAQTWSEVRGVNEAVREQLKAAGRLGPGKMMTAYQAADATEAQKREAQFYSQGQRALFLRRYGRFVKGEFCEIAGANERGVVLLKGGRRSTLSYRYADRITVASASKIEIAAGDRLQLKFSGKSADGVSLNNGELVTVRANRRNGALVVEDETGMRKTLGPSQRLFNRGYAVTSYASQGKTVDTVLLADAMNPAATNRNQWYVAISRARKRVLVFTSDKNELRGNIQRSGDRRLALELKPETSLQAEGMRRVVRRLPAWTRRARAIIQRLHQERFLRIREVQQVRQTLAVRQHLSIGQIQSQKHDHRRGMHI
jgi:ATP-dependent exoDNAse (exonuclease V) alpha subunit